MARRVHTAAVGIGAILTAALVAATAAHEGQPASRHILDARDGMSVPRGKSVYAMQCASCHGRFLQGQALWRLADENSHRRAPAMDGSGHTWWHSDDELYAMVRDGHYPSSRTPSATMPAFDTILPNSDIAAVLAFIKARWPTGLRVLQARRNPPASPATDTDWRFPPDCGPAAADPRFRQAEARTN